MSPSPLQTPQDAFIATDYGCLQFVRPNKTSLEEEIVGLQGLSAGEGSIYRRLIYVCVRVFGCIGNVRTRQIRRNVFQYVYFFPDLTSTNFFWW